MARSCRASARQHRDPAPVHRLRRPQSRPVTVILLAGGGRTARDWEKVKPAVSGVARVCSYDIAGMGESDKPPHDQSVDEIVDDLRALLRAAGEKPPYVLTRYSIAGLYCRRFATRFPDEVSGLVFVDSSHEEQFARLRQIVAIAIPRT